ncbi:MAG: 4Fe-4S binding protein [Chloroflexi bacterium]|nr:4Fe-4S binding protein [Chloroflexota bacterium]
MTPVINEVIAAIGQIGDFTPTYAGTRCLNQRHQRAGQCASCAAVCPTHAITLTPIPVIDGNACLSCGACSAACPVGALQGVRTLAEIWHDARSAMDSEGHLALSCRAVTSSPAATVRIPCACGLPSELYVALGMNGVRKVLLYTASCASCALVGGLVRAEESFRDAQQLLEPLGIELEMVRTDEPPPPLPQRPPQHSGVTRRGFFSALLKPQTLRVPEQTDLVDSLIAQGVNTRRALLINALQRAQIESSTSVPTYAGHWGALIASDACIGCQMCPQFCPTAALASNVDAEGRVTLWFDAARCTACGLCVRACFKHALALTESVQLNQLANSEYRALWNGRPPNNPLKSPQAFKQSRK